LTLQRYFAAPEFRVRHILAHTFNVLRQRPRFYLLVAAIAELPFLILDLHDIRPQLSVWQLLPSTIWSDGVFALGVVLDIVASAALVYAALKDLRGANFVPREPFRETGERLAPILWTSFLTMTVFLLGNAVLRGLRHSGLTDVLLFSYPRLVLAFRFPGSIVVFSLPGRIVQFLLCAAVPACIDEKLAPISSLRRGWSLARGHRGVILGLCLMVYAAEIMLQRGLRVETADPLLRLVDRQLLPLCIGAVGTAFGSILAAVIYRELRYEKEGMDGEGVVSVLD